MFIVALDGVLRDATGGPILDGILLYQALAAGPRLVVASDGTRADAMQWLRSHGLTAHDDVIGDEVALPDVDLRVRQVEVQRVKGRVDLVIDPDPQRGLAFTEAGLPVAIYAAGRFTRPEHRLTRERAKTWAELQQILDEREESRAVFTEFG